MHSSFHPWETSRHFFRGNMWGWIRPPGCSCGIRCRNCEQFPGYLRGRPGFVSTSQAPVLVCLISQLAALGIPLFWHKLQLGDELQWVASLLIFFRETWRAVLPQSHGKFSSNRKVAKGIQFFGSCHFYGPIADWFDLGNVAFGTVCFFLKFGRFRGRHLGFELVKDPSRSWLNLIFWAIWSPRWRRSESLEFCQGEPSIDRSSGLADSDRRGWDDVSSDGIELIIPWLCSSWPTLTKSRPSLSILTPFLGTVLTHSRHRSYMVNVSGCCSGYRARTTSLANPSLVPYWSMGKSPCWVPHCAGRCCIQNKIQCGWNWKLNVACRYIRILHPIISRMKSRYSRWILCVMVKFPIIVSHGYTQPHAPTKQSFDASAAESSCSEGSRADLNTSELHGSMDGFSQENRNRKP